MSAAKIELIDETLLTFDPENPRLPKSVDGSDEKEVINWMLNHENLTELMASLAEKGFFPAEPLLVTKSKTQKNKFEVIEGNRRLTAIKLLLNPELAENRKGAITEIISEGKEINTLKKIPCFIFDSSEEIQSYLGYRHITGVQPWDSLAKARYLKKLYHTLPTNIPKKDINRTLAKIIGSRADYVKLILVGLAVYEKIEENNFFKIKDLDEKSIKFGVLYTAINKSEIAEYIGLDYDAEDPMKKLSTVKLKDLSLWMFEKNGEGFTRLGESRNLKLLSKVVSNPTALKAFKEGGRPLRDAVLLTNQPSEIFQTSIEQSLNKIQTARDYVHLLESIDLSTETGIVEIRKMAKFLDDYFKNKGKEEEL